MWLKSDQAEAKLAENWSSRELPNNWQKKKPPLGNFLPNTLLNSHKIRDASGYARWNQFQGRRTRLTEHQKKCLLASMEKEGLTHHRPAHPPGSTLRNLWTVIWIHSLCGISFHPDLPHLFCTNQTICKKNISIDARSATVWALCRSFDPISSSCSIISFISFALGCFRRKAGLNRCGMVFGVGRRIRKEYPIARSIRTNPANPNHLPASAHWRNQSTWICSQLGWGHSRILRDFYWIPF